VLRPRPGRAAVEIMSRTWELPTAKAVTLLVHGLNGHARHASNMWTAHTLLNSGFTVVALDVEGHGLSGGVRGFVPDIETAVAGDVVAILLRTRACPRDVHRSLLAG
jgi:acylglycerol lipase